MISFQSTGVEELVEEVEIVLMRDINEALDLVYNRREAADVQRAARRNVVYEPIEYEYVPPEHFHTGNFPRLVLEQVPLEAYPYIVITVEDYMPDAEDAISDQMNIYRDALVIHCLSRASDEEGSEVVWRRSLRMAEAVFISLMSDPSMQRKLSPIPNPIRGRQSIPWTAQHKGRGKDWWFQSCGTQYAVKTFTSFFD